MALVHGHGRGLESSGASNRDCDRDVVMARFLAQAACMSKLSGFESQIERRYCSWQTAPSGGPLDSVEAEPTNESSMWHKPNNSELRPKRLELPTPLSPPPPAQFKVPASSRNANRLTDGRMDGRPGLPSIPTHGASNDASRPATGWDVGFVPVW